MAAAGNGLSRRRHRAGSFRDSPEEDGLVELPEAVRLRDRGGSSKKERDRERDIDREREREWDNRARYRLHSQSKRRRGERLLMVRGNINDGISRWFTGLKSVHHRLDCIGRITVRFSKTHER